MTNATQTPPIVDLESLLGPSILTATSPIVATIHQACRETGFFVAVGHGLDVEMTALFDLARQFFDQPQAVKEQTPRINRYGFIPQRDRALDQSRQCGNTEYLDLGLADEVPLPNLDGFADTIRAYQRAALTVASRVLQAIAISVDADAAFFAGRMEHPQCRLRLLHYPPATRKADGSLPIPTPAHTDYGAITLLATDGVPGLEVQPIGSGWIPVDAPANSLVINIGDMLSRWTNDMYQSTPHRVVGPVGRDRISIPFFINPDPATVVDCLPGCTSESRPCRYEPVTAGDFLASRIDNRDEPYAERFAPDERTHDPHPA